ncbi:MAG TPA: hypothetical protein VG839_05790 [Asticcacaulis sp.]|nr:hypothetical protein [Asticcacaulis sp.]
MNISNLAGRARALVLIVGLSLVASMGVTGAYAQQKAEQGSDTGNATGAGGDTPSHLRKKAPAPKPDEAKPADTAAASGGGFKIDPAKQQKAMADAPSLIAAAKISCEPVDAYMLGQTDMDKDGAKIKVSLYEIACKAGPGFLTVAKSPTEVLQSFTCMSAARAATQNKGGTVCVLAENKPPHKWLEPVAQTFIPGCSLNNARLIGSTTKEPLIDRYEIGCAASAGGLIDYPQLGADGKPAFSSCLAMVDTKQACTFTTKDQMIDSVKPLASAADKNCQVNNARLAGTTKEGDGYFYEIGCANQPGFMVQTKLDNTFVRSVTCLQATSLGGCSFTDTTAATADAKSDYTKALKAMGVTCTVADFNLIGTQANTKRDYVEFKCPEQPWGVIGFVPQPGGTIAGSVGDCFIDQTRRKACTYVTVDDLKAQVDKLIKIAQPTKGCDVSDVRYIGESQNVKNAVVVEIACANKRGYIGAIAADRKSLLETTPCKIALAHKDNILCEIPGNGTYATAD